MIQDRYKTLKEIVGKTALSSGRDPATIKIVAVTKGRSIQDIEKLYEAGCRDFGENRVQEALVKIDSLPSNCDWHLIGPIQTKKIPKILGKFSLIHSIGDEELLQKLNKACEAKGLIQRVLLQVNTTDEPQKNGLSESMWKQKLPSLQSYPSVRIEGLMTMGRADGGEALIRSAFKRLVAFQEILQNYFHEAKELSFGMSSDFTLAIEEGATILRVGSFLFETRAQ